MIPDDIIKACKNAEPAAQKIFYELTRPKMFLVIRRYINDFHEAEDVAISAYVKVFKNFNSFRGEGAIEAWVRRIFVNECLMFLRKNKNIFFESIADFKEEGISEPDFDIDFEEVMKFIETLPAGCKTVFNLYVFEELQHKEIAALLNISVSTSKSQYQLARQKILVYIYQKNNHE